MRVDGKWVCHGDMGTVVRVVEWGSRERRYGGRVT